MTRKQISDALLAITGEETNITALANEIVRVFCVDRDILSALEKQPSVSEAKLLQELLGECVLPFSVGDAVRAEAGRYDPIAAGGYPIREAILFEKGELDVADAVCAELGIDGLQVAAALHSELPRIDLTDSIMAQIKASSLAPPDAAVVPVAVNSRSSQWGTWAFGVAAIVLFTLLPKASVNVSGSESMLFASVTEVSVDSLDYSAQTNVQLFHGDDGPLVIWLDEEAVL
jgi:hypothetical protein